MSTLKQIAGVTRVRAGQMAPRVASYSDGA
jgi:hypothetical protein